MYPFSHHESTVWTIKDCLLLPQVLPWGESFFMVLHCLNLLKKALPPASDTHPELSRTPPPPRPISAPRSSQQCQDALEFENQPWPLPALFLTRVGGPHLKLHFPSPERVCHESGAPMVERKEHSKVPLCFVSQSGVVSQHPRGKMKLGPTSMNLGSLDEN